MTDPALPHLPNVRDDLGLKAERKSSRSRHRRDALLIAQLQEQIAVLTQVNLTLQAELQARQKQEAALRERAVRSRLFFDRVPVAVAMFDLQMRCVLASDCWRKNFLADRGSIDCDLNGGLEDETIADLFPETGDCWVEIHQHCLGSGEQFQEERSVCRENGTIEWYRWIVRPWHDETGKVGGTIAIAEAISSYKEIEEQLRESKQLFQLVMDNIPQLIFWKDRHSIYKGGNRSAARVAGLDSPEEFISKTDYDLPWTREEADWYRKCDRQVMDSGQPTLHIIETQQQADGRQAWLDTNKIPLRDAKGNVVGILVTVEDITERKQAEITLKQLNQELEQRVKARTTKLSQVVTRLKLESRERRYVEKQLRASEARLQRLADNIPGAIYEFQLDPDGRMCFPYVSSGFRDVFDLELEGLDRDATPVFERIQTEDFPGLQEAIAHSARTLENWQSEWRTIASSGKYKWCKGIAKPQRQPEGSILWYGCIVDITDRKRTEATIAVQQQRISGLVEQSPLAIIEWTQEFKVRAWNRAAETMFGYSREEVLGCRAAELIVPNSAEATVAEVMKELPKGTGGHYTVNENITKDGRCIVCEWHNQQLVDSQGQIVGVFSMVLDITDRKQAEVELAKLSLVASQTDSAVVITDRHGLTEWVNDSFVRISGYTLEEVRGKKPGDLLQGPQTDPQTVESIREALHTRTPFQGEILNYDKQGRSYWLWLNINPIFDSNGELINFVAIESDISERKEYELQLKQQTTALEQTLSELKRTQVQLVQSEKMSSLGQLVAGIAHEINNPVNFIYGNLTYVNEYSQDLLAVVKAYQECYPDPPPEIRSEFDPMEIEFLQADLAKLLRSMRVGAERIREIVLSLRTFSRLDEAEMKTVDIHEGIESTLTILQSRFKASTDRAEISLVKQYGQLPLVECYSGPLNQVFMNILANALDAIEERDRTRKPREIQQNPSTIRIVTEANNESGQVTIRIVDNGPGIPEEIQNQIFDPFFTTKDIGKGTGLGMSISYQIVRDKHRGSLECISQLGEGTEFTIRIPVRASVD
ncbi:MAG: PAS domain S-box protein [Cyanobacteriota bacterium]|nr:PAS domain S-box protein [Cyanobacteriota bacterium]